MRLSSTPEQWAAAFAATADDPAWSASCRLVAEGKAPSEMFQALALRPDILAGMRGLGAGVYPGGLLERDLKERVVVEVSRANECQYCAASHVGTLARRGLDPDAPPQTERERLARAYACAAVADANAVPDALFGALRAHFTPEEIVELTFLIGLTCLLNLFNSCLGVRYWDEYAFADGGADVQ